MSDDETVVGTVGSCCDIWRKYMFGEYFFRFVNRCTGESSQWDSNMQDAIDLAYSRGNCFPGARVWLILKNSVTKEQLAGVRVCLGLMCHDTLPAGETYLGQYVYGVYGLTAAATGYNNLVETITLSQTEYHLTRELVPTGEIDPTKGCEGFPDWLKPICVFLTGFVTAAITALTTTIITPLQEMIDDAVKVLADMHAVINQILIDAALEAAAWRESLGDTVRGLEAWTFGLVSDMYDKVETSLIMPLRASVESLWSDIGNLWSSIEEVIAAAETEVNARVKALSDLDKSIRAWIETSIIDVIISALDREVSGGTKK